MPPTYAYIHQMRQRRVVSPMHRLGRHVASDQRLQPEVRDAACHRKRTDTRATVHVRIGWVSEEQHELVVVHKLSCLSSWLPSFNPVQTALRQLASVFLSCLLKHATLQERTDILPSLFH